MTTRSNEETAGVTIAMFVIVQGLLSVLSAKGLIASHEVQDLLDKVQGVFNAELETDHAHNEELQAARHTVEMLITHLGLNPLPTSATLDFPAV